MARKAKKRIHPMPPLSFADKLIYWTVFVLLCVAYFALGLGTLFLRQRIAFSDSAVLAAEDNVSLLWLFVPWMTFFLMTFIIWLLPYQKRIPIFGRRNFKYGPPAWPRIYPLFMKNKPSVWVSEKKKQDRKRIAAVLLVVLLVSFIPFPWSLYGRDCLMHDGSIVQYNMFDRQAKEFRSGDIADVEVEVYGYRTGKYYKTRNYGVRMVFKTDSGEKYTFEQHEFRSNANTATPDWLEAMLKVKQRYNPEIVRYDGTDDLSRIVEDWDLNQSEINALYQLFDKRS